MGSPGVGTRGSRESASGCRVAKGELTLAKRREQRRVQSLEKRETTREKHPKPTQMACWSGERGAHLMAIPPNSTSKIWVTTMRRRMKMRTRLWKMWEKTLYSMDEATEYP